MGQAALRICVDQRNGTGAGAAGFYGQMTGDGGFSRASLLGCRNDCVQAPALNRPKAI